MVAYSHPLPRTGIWGVHWRRLLPAVAVAAVLGVTDTAWKAASLAASRGGLAVDTPTTLLRPLSALLVGLVALAGVLLVPRLCLPGLVLALAGAASNIVSLSLWHAVPDPLAVPVAGGILHFNLADLSIWSGALLFLTATLWTIWRLPADRFARLVGD